MVDDIKKCADFFKLVDGNTYEQLVATRDAMKSSSWLCRAIAQLPLGLAHMAAVMAGIANLGRERQSLAELENLEQQCKQPAVAQMLASTKKDQLLVGFGKLQKSFSSVLGHASATFDEKNAELIECAQTVLDQ